MRQSLWFILGMGIGGGTLALAAPGDLIHEASSVAVPITGAQAVCFADCAISAGSWNGARADMTQTCAWKEGPGVFRAQTRGVKTASPTDLATRAAAGEEIRVVGAVQ
jgi:hypothetical protein